MEKIFYCIWSNKDKKANNSYDPTEREEMIHFFNEDNGYTKEDIKSINELEKGEIYNCEYGNHSIERIS